MVMQSKYLGTGYLTYLKNHITVINKFCTESPDLGRNISAYLRFTIGIYDKIINFFILDYQRDDHNLELIA